MSAYTITSNEAFNSLEISFNEKPAEAIREALKALKFRWHGVKKVWYGYADRETVEKVLQGEQITAETTPKAEKTEHTQNHIKFYYNGLKIDGGELLKVYYYINPKQPDSVTISARDYKNLPRDIFNVENETDLYTDYFDNDSTKLTPDHPLFKYARYNALKARAKDAERTIKYNEKEMQRGEVWKGFLDSRRKNIEEAQKIIETFKNEIDPGQPTAEDLEQIDRARQEAENERRRQEHEAELAERERVLNRRATGRRFIEEIAKIHPIKDGEPVVEIPFSEDPAFYSWTTSEDRTKTTLTLNADGTTTKETEVLKPADKLLLSVTAADLVLYHFDMMDVAGKGYFKTDFVIRYNDPETGKESTYNGRYDLGDRDGGLIAHIENFGKWYLTHDQFGHKKDIPDVSNDIVRFAQYLKQFIA